MASYEMKKKKGNLPLFLLVFFFAGGYLFFFSSTVWMPASSSATLLTPLAEDTQWEDRTFQIVRWDYCEKTGTMEVELDVQNNAYDGIDKYLYSAKDRKNSDLTVETVIQEPDWIVLQIKKIKKNFGEMSLRIDMPAEKKEADTLHLYTNMNDVTRVDTLKTKDRAGYQRGRFEIQIENYQKTIAGKEKQILSLGKEKEQMQEEINRLQKKTAYQTEEQKEETDTQIKDIQGNIATKEEEIQKLQTESEELKERIVLANKQIEEIQKDMN